MSATFTITSYCSPSRLKRVTCRPPSMVSSVRPKRVDLDADRRRLVAVDVNFELRRVELEVGIDIDEARIVARPCPASCRPCPAARHRAARSGSRI